MNINAAEESFFSSVYVHHITLFSFVTGYQNFIALCAAQAHFQYIQAIPLM